jgi:alkaline phosphatase
MDMEGDDVTLAEFTAKGIELLDNPDGFFMMVEGGKIDWACHANDAAASIHNTIAFDDAVKEAITFYKEHPAETLIVVTGDHECGGLTLGFAGTKYETAFKELAEQTVSFEKFNADILNPYKEKHSPDTADITDLLDEIETYFGLTVNDLTEAEQEMVQRAFTRSMKGNVERAAQEDTAILYGGYEPLTVTLTHILNQKAGLSWTSYSHTAVPVPTFALGVGASQFNGYYDNTDIFHKMVKSMGISSMAAAK